MNYIYTAFIIPEVNLNMHKSYVNINALWN